MEAWQGAGVDMAMVIGEEVVADGEGVVGHKRLRVVTITLSEGEFRLPLIWSSCSRLYQRPSPFLRVDMFRCDVKNKSLNVET
jgi:hypothetical protein